MNKQSNPTLANKFVVMVIMLIRIPNKFVYHVIKIVKLA
jgi:hypothetical protein